MFCIRTAVVEELPQLRRYALFLARDPVFADDLVQDCIARAIDKSAQFSPGTNFRAWLFTILRSVFLNHQRRAASQPFDTVDASTVAETAVRGDQEVRVELRELERALAQLSASHRDILLLIVIEGFSYEETAQILEVPIGTVRSRLARARGALHSLLHDETDRSGQVAPGDEAYG